MLDTMNEEEHFVNIDLNDENVCSICKLETETETLSFCHICFELSIEGIPRSNLVHTNSVRGHKDCFEKCHLIINQDRPRAKVSQSSSGGVKSALSKKINWIIQYAQNKDSDSAHDSSKNAGKSQQPLLNYGHAAGRQFLPSLDYQVPKYSSSWPSGFSDCAQGVLDHHGSGKYSIGILSTSDAELHAKNILWASENKSQRNQPSTEQSNTAVKKRTMYHSKEELMTKSAAELRDLVEKLVTEVQEVFENLTHELQKKDSMASELHVRHIAIEQLFKNCSKLPWLQIGRAGVKPSVPVNNGNQPQLKP
ncbi:protein EURL homolog [Protopterus annectens]|uniref:protein EURL homolog n=1 Tax=Protopterus annectens TaxID=7888 RepID=UPI001CFB55D9|nr:protein EURL homolog [Protopterus annectens]